jgi:hypothetical protein
VDVAGRRFFLCGILGSLAAILACGVHGSASDVRDLLFGNGGKIPRDKLAVQNEFVPNPKGDAETQGADIRNTLNLRHVRASFYFDESFLPNEASQPNFSRFDEILASIPADSDLLPILAYAPQWLAHRGDWKAAFIARYVIPVLDRYGGDGRIAGWEIWNEPDGFCNGHVAPPGVLDCSPADYVDLVARVAPEIRKRSGAPIVGAATTSINQSFPDHFNFNEDMVNDGLLPLIDVYNFHWYGEQLEKLTFGGIANFLNGTGKRVWCTESGAQGSTHQLEQVQDVFPALDDNLDRLERIYIFTYFDGASAGSTYGLVSAEGIESDLYQYLRDHP